MEAAYSGDVTVFSAFLERHGQPFLWLDDSDSSQAHLRFVGRYQGREVVWDCRFVTLKAEVERLAVPRLHCFIDIGAVGQQGVPIRVGLNIAEIDRPAVLKMIVMIRNYKRLRPGRQEFGDSYPPCAE